MNDVLFPAIGDNPTCSYCDQPLDVVRGPQFSAAWCECWDTNPPAVKYDATLHLEHPSHVVKLTGIK